MIDMLTPFSQVSDMNAQLAQVRLKTDKEKEDSRRTHEELAAVKKVSALTNTLRRLTSTTARVHTVLVWLNVISL